MVSHAQNALDTMMMMAMNYDDAYDTMMMMMMTRQYYQAANSLVFLSEFKSEFTKKFQTEFEFFIFDF